jgi:hypothetical protein
VIYFRSGQSHRFCHVGNMSGEQVIPEMLISLLMALRWL